MSALNKFIAAYVLLIRRKKLTIEDVPQELKTAVIEELNKET